MDGCRNNCKKPFCGDGIVDAGETCDDGNSVDNDGCRNDCAKPVCGDGKVDQGEQCDDGNTNNMDGCRNSCKKTFCGDGIVDPGEDCDDGNKSSGDGCSKSCKFEVSQGTCPQDSCAIFSGPVDYATIGNSMSYSEDRTNCRKKTSSSASLSVPNGAKVVKAYLQWSGSGFHVDNRVSLNGHSVYAAQTLSQKIYNTKFFGAYADVTKIVKNQGGGHYTVKNLTWDNKNPFCHLNAAYGAWSLVVVYSTPTADSGTRVHVCQDKFKFTYPAGHYSTSIKCIDASYSCSSNGELTLVTFESDGYKGEKVYVGGKYMGDNLFNGATAPNLDIKTFNLDNKVIKGNTNSLSYSFKTYRTYTSFGVAVEGLIDFVKVVKYRSKCH